jgi:V/A-type H+-transporting ATPase subunit I
MKEVWLFTLSSTVEDTIQELGELGVMQIKHIQAPEGAPIERLEESVTKAAESLALLKPFSNTEQTSAVENEFRAVDFKRMIGRTLMAVKFKSLCQKRRTQLMQQLSWYQIWGANSSPGDIRALAKKGIYIRLYLIEKKQLAALPEDKFILRFAEQAGKVPIALTTRSATDTLPFTEVSLPRLPLETIRQQIVRKERQLASVGLYLADMAENIPLLQAYHDYLNDQLNARKVSYGMGEIDGQIRYLRGYIPHDQKAAFVQKAQEKKWGYRITEPENPEEVPVYIKNPKWVSMINPVMRFIDIVPGYKEVDVSVYFLIAFALFFAMLVGDAGYGTVFLLLTLVLRKKIPKQLRLLIYVLSGATIVWGVLSGTYFGSEKIAALPFFERLVIPQIASFGTDNISFMMHLSFLIGAIHLTAAHAVRFFQFINSIRALSEVGWIAFIWGLFFVVESLVLGREMPEWSNWLFLVGAILVAFFSREGKSFTSSVLISLGNLPLSLINGFSDIVSYVRLFAVGMATAMVAASFNDMILSQEGTWSFLGIVGAAVALLLGHGINIILALMAVMVHGIRLNMLEFAGHLGVQFSGEAFRPFKLKIGEQSISKRKGINSTTK